MITNTRKKKMRYSQKMKDVAFNLQIRPESIPSEIQRYINDEGLSLVEVADEKLGISKATLGYWLRKFDLEVVKLVLAPHEEVIIKRTGSFDPGSNVIVP
jgi:hypothetical protein|tara:strand:+ start:338 stop:637 length:300 start_codon:yes stop_codon:yes gene_type:complete